jgi:two-component system cell cycle sensor histidine kinase/response regulator CckA
MPPRITLVRSLHQSGMQTVDEFSHPSPAHVGAGLTVLVVDDETAVRRFAVRVLQRDGYDVIEASDGAEAVELLRSAKARIDIIVSDIVMPRMNGVELMQAVAELHLPIPVVLMSGYATAALAELGIATPCSILPKPFPAERLLAEVHRCVRGRGGSSAA